jgi:hypothetical protein
MIAALLIAQMVMPADAREAKRFQAAQAAAAHAGYADAAVFWHADDWFVLEGGREMDRFLLFVIAPAGKQAAVLELGKSERLNMLGVEVTPLLAGVIDVVLSKQPFQYETSTTQVTHDLIALEGKPRLACHVDGSVRSSTAKGPVTWEHHREVKLAAEGDVLVVTSTEETIQRPNHGPGEETRTPGPSSTRRYQLAPEGACKEIKP